MGSRDMNPMMLFYAEVQFREKRIQYVLIQLESVSSVSVFNLKLLGTTKAKRPNEAILAI